MNVCMTIFDDVAYDSRLHKEIGSVRAWGHQVAVLCATYARPRGTARYNGAVKQRVYVGRKASGKWRFVRFLVGAPLRALGLRADVYHAQDLYTLPVAYAAGKLRSRPVVYDSRELFLDTASLSGRPFERWLWRVVERSLVPHVDQVVTVCDAIAEALRTRYRIRRPLVVRNCPAAGFRGGADLLRGALGISSGTRILLYLGGLQEGRGLFNILESLRYLPGHLLIAMGAGPLSERLAQHARNLHVEDQVRFMPPVPVGQILGYAASADLGLCLIENAGFSYAHALPNKLFEYIAAGLPLVASDLPEMRRVVEEEGIGVLTDPENPRAIARAVRTLLDDAELYSTCRAHCASAYERYNWERESQPLAGVYRHLACRTGVA